ncbi:threonylcarbamoyl-AMP synthase [candidate division KSB1 bacterium]|nr:threonylcarbamoyl-AMP synthase [candidate division KSB1 bacterium]RQW04603.1 MAG: threonylcarbamoyl-AMP synthase [candidate division KSB1 bacterium]
MDRLYTYADNPQPRHIRQAIDILRDGGLIIYPTDTVYGLGCDLFNKRAVERIYQIKGFTKKSRLSFICPDLKNIAKYAHVSTPAYKIMRRLLPGPFTFILQATREVPRILVEKRKNVGIRVPDNLICYTLLQEFGHPIISTSATLQGIPYLNDPEDISEVFEHKVELFLDSDVGGLEPSTVIDLSSDEPTIIRKGKGYNDDLLF